MKTNRALCISEIVLHLSSNVQFRVVAIFWFPTTWRRQRLAVAEVSSRVTNTDSHGGTTSTEPRAPWCCGPFIAFRFTQSSARKDINQLCRWRRLVQYRSVVRFQKLLLEFSFCTSALQYCPLVQWHDNRRPESVHFDRLRS